jgi:predicted tellurium resistance membrane protein TerC
MDQLFTAENIVSLITLTFLEIVLGIDNIIFISIAANKLAPTDQPKARNIGLLLAMAFRIALLFGISALIALSKPFIEFDLGWFKAAPSGQGVILIIGGLFPKFTINSKAHPNMSRRKRVKRQRPPFRVW